MNKIKNLCATAVSVMLALVGCIAHSPLDQALSQAGENRKELEALLNHYSIHPEDSLKLKAACFLIENMPAYYYYENEKREKLKQEIYSTAVENGCYAKKAYELLEKKYGPVSPAANVLRRDIETVSSQYLIRNIEWAFKAWQEAPWGKQVDFEQFCREILPYRIADEPLEEWRETYYRRYKPLVDSLLTDKESLLEASQILYDTLVATRWIFDLSVPLPRLGALTLLDGRYGQCIDRCDLALYAMRALGIPAGIDMIVQNPDRKYAAHYWNYFTHEGSNIEFTLHELRPEVNNVDTTRKKGKVYRILFDEYEHSLPNLHPTREIPPSLRNRHLKEVSSLYYEGVSVAFPVRKELSNELIYLGVFNNREWIPIAWSNVEKGKAHFDGLEPGVAYMPLVYRNGKTEIIGTPLLTRADGSVTHLTPDFNSPQEMALRRKHPLPNWWSGYIVRAKNGKFQLANRKDFSNALTVHTLDYEISIHPHSIQVESPAAYRYARYLSGEGGYCNMAELAFYDAETRTLTGNIIGTEGSYKDNPDRTKEAVFDNDPLTFFDATEASGAWVGMDFGKPVAIRQIDFLFRNDDNNIRPGDHYELFYFSPNGPVSAGKREGDNSRTLIYEQMPANALFLLRNYTRGEEERVFTYEENEQVWW